MGANKISEEFVKNLLFVFPYWHARLVRPFKEMLDREMSLETYYCLQTLKVRGTATMTELAQQLRVPKQQVTKLVDRLYMHGFVERTCREEDRRVITIMLTPKAVSYMEEYPLKHTEFIHGLEEKLTKEELGELNHAAEILRRILPKLS